MGTDGTTQPNTGDETTPQEITRLVRDLLEAWNAHDVERIKTFYAPDYEGVDVGQAKPQSGPQGVARLVKRYLQAFPNLYFVAEDVVVQGNRAVLVWTAHATHRGELMRIPPPDETSWCAAPPCSLSRTGGFPVGCTSGTWPPYCDPSACCPNSRVRKERTDDDQNSR
jgi:predicted ester cyclase